MSREGTKKPMFYLSWDKSGMYLWLGSRPKKNDGLFRQTDPHGRTVNNSVRMRLPVSWFGGLVDEGDCREFDPEAAFGISCA